MNFYAVSLPGTASTHIANIAFSLSQYWCHQPQALLWFFQCVFQS